jgi:CRP/FNR family transcriptional regulator, transcriptional activator FtrB
MALNQNDAKRVQAIHLFKEVTEQCMPILLSSASMRYFPGRILLFKESDRATFLYSLLQGSVELFSETHDRRSTIAVIRSVKPFVLTSIAHDVNPMSARTLERSQLLLVPLKAVHELICNDPMFARAITYELAGGLRDIIEDFKKHRLRTTMERLAEWILRADQDAGGTGHFMIPYGKRILASQLGMAPENLSRNLASLASLGVAVQGRRISLNDRAALAAIARTEADHPA